MSGLARWCFQHRRWVAAAWLLAMVAVVGLGKAAGSDFGSSFSLPNTDSQAAVTLLTQNFPAASGEGDQVVIQATARLDDQVGGGAGRGDAKRWPRSRRCPGWRPSPVLMQGGELGADQPGRHHRLRHGDLG